MSFLSFGFPLALTALLVLPALWWLLRSVPPKPSVETFPPFIILEKLKKKQQTPDKTPWWLLLLRLLMVGFIIIALAEPVFRPAPPLLNGENPLVLIIDNSWAAADDWKTRQAAADSLLNEAGNAPIYILATANAENQEIGPFTAAEATERLTQITVQPLPVNRQLPLKRLQTVLETKKVDLAYFTDGLSAKNDEAAFSSLASLNRGRTLVYTSDIGNLVAITGQTNTANALTVTLIRAPGQGPSDLTVAATEKNGLRLGEVTAHFADGATKTTTDILLPLEMRNDVSRITILPTQNAAMSFLIGAENARKKVGLLSPPASQMTQPLLTPLYYVSKALTDSHEVITVSDNVFSEGLDRLINQQPSVIVIGDVAAIADENVARLNQFIAKGGMVIRFAGPNLAASEHDDTLLPVKLRRGERSLGGVMSWAAPQKIGTFTDKSPFYGLTVPDGVTVSRQILADPQPGLFEKSWMTLADGTPLITAEQRGNGWLVFVHTSMEPSWTNLPLSGFLETMLNKLIAQAGAVSPSAAQQNNTPNDTVTLAPWRVLDGYGTLIMPGLDTQALVLHTGATPQASLKTPPGFYGRVDQLTALNLLPENAEITPLHVPQKLGATELHYQAASGIDLKGLFLLLAAILFAVDCFITLWMMGGLRPRFLGPSKTLMFVLCATALMVAAGRPHPAFAQMSDEDMVKAAGKTHLAYVISGNEDMDDTSKKGLETLSAFIFQRTTINPGPVKGLDLEKDELAFYPLIYWPLDAESPPPSQKAIEKINAYMHNGGTVLFDTRDEFISNLDLDAKATPTTNRLRDILGGLDIPPLEAAPADHVVARSYYLMPDFPGRYRGSPLWVEALSSAVRKNEAVRGGDGVSAVIITANDFAGAWAHDNKGGWKYALLSNDPSQRVWSLRGGLNIVMYVLTGNYKTDQVHAPEILKRLGQENGEE